ncbi:alpha/beta fold hydrolase [Streptomyces sp. 2A115]|uniref:alpha/beta fold hydrolase n=1 Tax=Streptomyces sp. 2A115 TaxID=3457439 RepID=UPI003FD32084
MADMTVDYDGLNEFGLLEENAKEAGLPFTGSPPVRREMIELGSGLLASALVWGERDPEVVLLHGGAQNAHTWDTFALALGRPLIAVDLPGHGHSSWRADRDYRPPRNAEAVAAIISRCAPHASAVVGVCLGGLTAIRLAASRPDLVSRLVVIDITPAAGTYGAITAFVQGPETFESFDEMLDRAVRYHPHRLVSSLRRGLLHNARRRPDGRWAWRYDRPSPPGKGADYAAQWTDLSALRVPVMLVRGSLSNTVSDSDIVEFRRRQPAARVETIDGAGHSVQGDRPVELAGLIDDFLSDPPGRAA